MTIRIEIVGALRAHLHGTPVTPSQPKLRALLALLAATPDAVVRHETIAEELWSEPPSTKRARIVQTYVSQLRKLLGAAGVCAHTPKVGYRLDLGAADYLDTAHLLRLRDTAEAHLRAGDPATAAEVLGAAVDLCRGEVLSDVSLGTVLRLAKARLDLVRVGVLERYLRVQLDLGRPDAVLAQVDRVVREDPRHEQLYASLLLGFAVAGQRARATDLFHDVRARLATESGLEPGLALRSAFERALSDDPTAGRAPVAAVRRLRGHQRPEQVLPVGTVVGYGPQAEFARVELTRRPRATPAVLAVVGAPGAGTTTFCARLADETRAAYPDGRVLADLAQVDTAEALAGFLRAVRPGAAVPDGLAERARLWHRHTGAARLLVVLDNVTSATDLAALSPVSTGSATLLGCAERLTTPVAAVSLPGLATEDLVALLAARVGQTRVDREPRAADALMARCAGLPLVAAILSELVRLRPHWSLGRLAARLGTDLPMAAGGLDLAQSVSRAAAGLDPVQWAALVGLAHRDDRPDILTAEWTTRTLSLPRAESFLWRLTTLRLAEPAPRIRQGTPPRYRVAPLYLRAVRALVARPRPTLGWHATEPHPRRAVST
ncbi:AfsR/SARP family transcriptional regulator [Actinokineospora cianjurensis]|uniref:DNA-binding SARP family transcriptional activator n=1 Tax=Actinokineospora cianjurensis TaxID=585224 RepID=A0A421B2X0_9PSEU|nr:BTAD domain-containing putative transcriptional regulator [Actinokineospora cianjurensis]RLK58675.1 DNA-binding SARP family transcriptional activator [Actinokineospora cianjurensis]